MKRAILIIVLGLSMAGAYAMCEEPITLGHGKTASSDAIAKINMEPLVLSQAQVARLREAQSAISMAQMRYEAELRQVALELKLDLDTHELKLVEVAGKVVFAVKEKK